MKKIVVANWKMRPDTLSEAEDLFRISTGAIVCPPFVYLEELSKVESGAALGAQDIALSDEPGQTGEISGQMLVQFGVKYVLIGHSERRWPRSRSSDSGSAAEEQSELTLRGESDAVVNAKLKITLKHELIPIVCVGEKSRDIDFKSFLEQQVLATFAGLPPEEIQKCLIAYEPVWAISTTPDAQPDTPESALESIEIITGALIGNCPDSVLRNRGSSIRFANREKLKIENLPKTLYGGSVTAANVMDFLIKDEISGVLVGGASLNKEEFKKILEIASNV